MLLSVFAVRLLQVQGIDPKAFAANAAADGLVNMTLPASRGEIVDRNGSVLAQSVAGEMIVADPVLTRPHAAAIAKILADRLHLDYFSVLQTLSQKGNVQFAYIARRIPATTADSVVSEIQKHNYAGISTAGDPLRDYPGGDVASNMVGFMNDANKPAAGMEQTFDNMLSGHDGHETFEIGGDGNRIPLGENTQVSPVNGKTLHLTIDRDVQWYAQRLLRNTVHKWHAQSAAAVVMDTRTGQLLALADSPTYDANKGSQAPPAEWTSRALSGIYDPGSVEKVLTMSALIDAGLVTPKTHLVVPGALHVLDRYIHDDWSHGNLPMTLTGVLARSSNIGAAMAGLHLPPEKLYHYLRQFGLGSPVRLGIPGETSGILPPGSQWNKLTQAQIAFGQGLSVDALQMAGAINTVANHGVYISPSLIKGAARTNSGNLVGSSVAKTHRVVSAHTASEVSKMMERVVTAPHGTGPMAAIPGYRVAGKTGTAQEPGGPCHCYADGGYDTSFAGFAPADNPRFTVYVVVKKPQGGSAFGGTTAGPVWHSLMAYVLQKYDVPPTGTKPSNYPVTW